MSESLENINKRVVKTFCDLYTRGRWEDLGELLADDFRWKAITSQRRQSPMFVDVPPMNSDPGFTKHETLEIFRTTQKACVDGRFDLTPLSFTAEGNRVAFEAESFAINRDNGRTYDNRYHHLMTFREGKIIELREYQDTVLVLDVWMAP
jgi:ketosteroid isomerase-like protein